MLPAKRHETWMPDFFNDFFDNDWMNRAKPTAPAINVLEHENGYELEVAAPGLTREDFNVTLDKEGDLVINMEKKASNEEEDKKNGHYLRREFSYGKFQQTMLLPDDADRDNISAKMENGVLTIGIPKIAKVKPEDVNRRIEIK